jgi:rRNA-processing protein FCF1
MNYEKEYIQYLIENQVLIDTSLLDNYFLNKIDFETLIESVNPLDVQSYKNFVKSKTIDELLK